MKILLLAVGTRMPNWVTEAYELYAKRLPRDYQLILCEIPLPKRGKNVDITRTKQEEAKLLLNAIPENYLVIALDEHGESFTTLDLAKKLRQAHDLGQNWCLLVGGPDGLATECLQRATARWSLSTFTLPHPLVRVIVAEQMYRAYSCIVAHPYHRE